MTNIQTINHVEDCVPLYLPHSLYLKPLAKMYISVALPGKKTGKSISNLDIMDKLSAALKPDKFFVLKVIKNTIDFIRFEAELEQRSRLKSALSKLDGISLRIAGFSESFRVRATEAKDEFPTRHDWDSFFRDASHMDEMKAGERPDTIHLTHLPIRWFCPRHAEHDENVKPSESIFKRIFEKFGSVRCVDIPICDAYRNKMNSDINGMKTFSFEQDVLFEAYVQFDEYCGFTRAMDEFRGMKLVRKYVDKTMAINITVDFDKTKHLSDAQIQRRERVRSRLIAKAQAEEEDKERQKRLEEEKLERKRQKEEQEKMAELERQREREEKRKLKHLKKIQERGQVEISQEIRVEERKLMIAQRKLESIRILEALFDRMRIKHLEKHKPRRDSAENEREKARVRLVDKYKTATENLVYEQREKVNDLKSKTPLLGLLSKKSRKQTALSSDDDEKSGLRKRARTLSGNGIGHSETSSANNGGGVGAATTLGVSNPTHINPFKAVAALAAAGPTANYNTEAASEWMKSLTMLPYVSPMFPHPLYRPQAPAFPISVNYRGFAPRIRGGRGRGRGRGRGNYNNYYNNHKNYKYGNEEEYEDEAGSEGEHHKSSYSRSRHYSRSRRSYSRHRSSSRSRSRNRSRTRRSHSRHSTSRSRSRSRTRYSRHRRSYTRSYTKSRSRSRTKSRDRFDSKSRSHTKSREPRSRSPSKTNNVGQNVVPPQRLNKKLVSTRRSRSTESDLSRYHSRSRSNSRSRSQHRSGNGGVVIETDNLVRSAEEIKRTIEKTMQDRMREEEREIKETFRSRKSTNNSTSQTFGDGDSGGTAANSTLHSPQSQSKEIEEDERIFEKDKSEEHELSLE